MRAEIQTRADRAVEGGAQCKRNCVRCPLLARWRAARTTRAELGQLSDVELKDIGLVRGDIDFVAAQAA